MRRYDGPGGELAGLLLKLVPTGLFDLCPYNVRMRGVAQLPGPFLPLAIYSHPR
jgi:hypothetical protein